MLPGAGSGAAPPSLDPIHAWVSPQVSLTGSLCPARALVQVGRHTGRGIVTVTGQPWQLSRAQQLPKTLVPGCACVEPMAKLGILPPEPMAALQARHSKAP